MTARPPDGLPARPPGLEIWGGIEATIARIGDDWRDQVHETGHDRRADDLDRIADLGITALRYPILWESFQAGSATPRGWGWHAARLDRLRALGIAPIAGLVHHGSGPAGTSLVDRGFAAGVQRHAAEAARRFPWIGMWTPVNEPLTTARFSALYGHWYPHRRDMRSFLQATLIQCRAVVLAMAAIRRENPQARLVQTEDLGKTFAVPALCYQADYENERRFLSFDLLCGRVDRDHPMWGEILAAGVDERDLAFFLENPCPPDVMGMNHYLTSERFLDDRLALYPASMHGGNAFGAYADVEAVRAGVAEEELGPKARLRDLWERYRRPVAISECHHGCTREEQLRWLADGYRAAVELSAEGADVRGLTVWALFGVVDWSSLLTRRAGHYEPGAFDVRTDPPRETAIASMVRRLAGHSDETHPVLDGAGWWRRPDRVYPHVEPPRSAVSRPRRLLLLADGGDVRTAGIVGVAAHRGLDVDGAADAREADILAALSGGHYWGVLDLRRPDHESVARVSDACRRQRLRCLVLSTWRVFDGRLARPYVESDPVAPGCEAGSAAAARERSALAAWPDVLIVRPGPILTVDTVGDPLFHAFAALAAGRPASFAATAGGFSYLPDLAHAAFDLLIDGASGVWHLANEGDEPWDDLLRRTAREAGLGGSLVEAANAAAASTVIASERGRLMPDRAGTLARYLNDVGLARR